MTEESGTRRYGYPQNPSLARDILELGKPRITGLVLVTTAMGFYLGTRGQMQWDLFGYTLLGTLLVSFGIHTLNQWLERDIDGLMPRTANRPLPNKRLPERPVLAFGLVALAAGLGVLFGFTNPLAGMVGVSVAVLYVAVYTPLKRVSQLNTFVGAIPGALPPVLGWAVSRGSLDAVVLSLFLIMITWQFPHFMPIAWLYRKDYANAGLAMISVADPTGNSIRRQSVVWTLVLISVSLLPYFLQAAGLIYLIGAVVLGALFFAVVLAMVRQLDDRRARWVLKASVLYLPLLLLLLISDSTLF